MRGDNTQTVKIYILFILIFLLVAGAKGSELSISTGTNIGTDVSCFNCHSDELKEFQKSVHNNILCTDCHGGNRTIIGAVSTGAMYTDDFNDFKSKSTDSTDINNVTELCSKCHSKATAQYKESIHWAELEKGKGAASCFDCHGKVHSIQSSVYLNPNSNTNSNSLSISQICANCHENQTKMSAWYYGIKTDRYDTYKKSYHYKALISGGTGLATCSDCHENHDTRNESDPESAIYSANLPVTCGKTGCHPGQNTLIYGGKVHEGRSVYISFIDAKKLVTYFYIIMILFELTFTLGLISLDVYSRLDIKRRR